MRPDSYKREDAERIINNAVPKYLILGFKSDSVRCIPATYHLVLDMAADEEEVYEKIIGLEVNFKVFSVGLQPMSSGDWVKAVAALKQTKTEKEERELLRRLKDKYENK